MNSGQKTQAYQKNMTRIEIATPASSAAERTSSRDTSTLERLLQGSSFTHSCTWSTRRNGAWLIEKDSILRYGMEEGDETHLRITYWKMNPTALRSSFGMRFIHLHFRARLTPMGHSWSPLQVGWDRYRWIWQGCSMVSHCTEFRGPVLTNCFMISFMRNEENENTHLTYLKRLLGYLLLISHGMAGATAPIKKKNTRAWESISYQRCSCRNRGYLTTVCWKIVRA